MRDITKLSRELQRVVEWNPVMTVFQLTFTKGGQATNVYAANVGVEIDGDLSKDLNMVLLVDEWDVLHKDKYQAKGLSMIFDWENAKVTNNIKKDLSFILECGDTTIEGKGKRVTSEMQDTGEDFEEGFKLYYLAN